jgi:hypothetical protein
MSPVPGRDDEHDMAATIRSPQSAGSRHNLEQRTFPAVVADDDDAASGVDGRSVSSAVSP